MAKAKNKVIAGDYEGSQIDISFGTVSIKAGFLSGITVDRNTVKTYELITDEHRKSAASGVARGLVGGALLGPVGMLAGGLTAKSKDIYQIAMEFTDGKRSLIEVDDKIYKAIVKKCF